ncbi:hypothetical protein VNO78_21478 [Psophocarpus tetragonolobus]|uniref:Uncharacterized protein n=1 Tax=Psophocarpus tetragonolobus TaxID=3891 RepID=A0AAN9SGN1_PSOTE
MDLEKACRTSSIFQTQLALTVTASRTLIPFLFSTLSISLSRFSGSSDAIHVISMSSSVFLNQTRLFTVFGFRELRAILRRW